MAGIRWFQHDVRAHGDPSFEPLLAKHGAAGYGWYWMLVERAHEDGPLLDVSDPDTVAGMARGMDMTAQQLNDFVSDCCRWGLFDADAWQRHVITSPRICLQRERYDQSVESGKRGAAKRWK